MPKYRIPIATYRVQFNPQFRFLDGLELVPYLHDLGITDLYCSPRFQAQRGSRHGYDVINPLQVNSELGTEQDFDDLALKLQHYGMGLVLDIVPNHMAASSENPWWRDVLENGPASDYASFFDINWHPATSKAAFLQDNKVLLPVLGDLYGNALENQELSLKLEDIGFLVRYYERKLPLNPKSSRLILEHSLGVVSERLDADHEAALVLKRLLAELERLPDFGVTDPEQRKARQQQKNRFKEELWSAYREQPEVRKAIDETLLLFNGTKGDRRSFDFLDRILSDQAYRLAYWKIGYEEINYRRFFDINELVGLNVELPEVFDLRHRRILDLVRENKVTGLRVDHIDGLRDPYAYLCRLRDSIDPDGGFYIVVEKILGRQEVLPSEWPAAGTTGYDFLNAVNEIFIDPEGLERMVADYARHTAQTQPFAEICYASNKQAMRQLFPGDVNRLGHDLARLAAQDRQGRDIPVSELMQVLIEVTACLPIYRTYIRDFAIASRDREYIERTLRLARRRTAENEVSSEAFAFMRRVLLLEPPYYAEEHKQAWLEFVMRWQQFSGPVMAKGLEDTATYVDSALISRNEVGGDPLREQPPRDLPAFHRFNRRRLESWPYSMSASSTHDSKRSEDVRARINVLSELSAEWGRYVEDWFELNRRRRRVVNGREVPDRAEEILIYQTLLGAWPFDAAELGEFSTRVQQFLLKAAREAKVHSSWIRPDTDYEEALTAFARSILEGEPDAFLESFLEFERRIAFFGALNSLSQLVLKIASPGVPDFYQGSEIWNFTLVDPDNRRPVNYRKRTELLDELRRRAVQDRGRLICELVRNWQQDGIKMYVTYSALEYRRMHGDLFLEGAYIPVESSGEHAENVCAFARHRSDEWTLAVAPRWPSRLGFRSESLTSAEWGKTTLELPAGSPRHWTNVFTGRVVEADAAENAAWFEMAGLLRDFPVALLAAPAV